MITLLLATVAVLVPVCAALLLAVWQLVKLTRSQDARLKRQGDRIRCYRSRQLDRMRGVW